MKEAVSEFGTKLLCVLNRGWLVFRPQCGSRQPGHSLGSEVLGVSCNGKRVKGGPENAGMDGWKVTALEDCDGVTAGVATACESVGGSVVNRL